ncbi:unnamed protein product [Musa acuminata subsp. burmannicoides]
MQCATFLDIRLEDLYHQNLIVIMLFIYQFTQLSWSQWLHGNHYKSEKPCK